MSALPMDHSAAGDATEVELQQMNKLVGNIYAFEKSYLQRL